MKILEKAFATMLEQVASGNQDLPIVDSRNPDKIFLTEYARIMPDGKLKMWAGPRIQAENIERARVIGNVLGLRVLGEFTGSEPASEELIDRVKEAKDRYNRRN